MNGKVKEIEWGKWCTLMINEKTALQRRYFSLLMPHLLSQSESCRCVLNFSLDQAGQVAALCVVDPRKRTVVNVQICGVG